MTEDDELLRLEYEHASRLLGSLTEIRFKLLGAPASSSSRSVHSA